MKSIHTLRLLGLAGISTLLAGNALAQQDSYHYFGLSAGQSKSQLEGLKIANQALTPGMTATLTERDTGDSTYKLFLGHQFNRNLAIEGSYFSLGQFGNRADVSPAGSLFSKLKIHGLGLDLVGSLPLSQAFAVFVKAGIQNAQATNKFGVFGGATVTEANPRARHDTRSKFGAGFEVAFNPSFLMRAELERYQISDGTGGSGRANAVTVGLVFPFGRGLRSTPYAAKSTAYEAPVAAAPAPAPAPAPVYSNASRAVEAAQAPAPVAVAPMAPVAVAAPRQQVSYSAESWFGFDDSTVRPEGKEALDAFGRELDGTEFMTITVEGYADRLGSTAYNQTLSLQRADAVKSYLVTNTRVDPRKITTVGRSESDPVTHAGDCKGDEATKSLVKCLQPDRRVGIVVFGSR